MRPTTLVPLALLAACAGGDPSETPTDGIDPTTPLACEPGPASAAPVRKLTRTEYDNSIRDLVGLDEGFSSRLPADPEVHGFDNAAQVVSVSQLAADGYMRASEDVTAALDEAPLLPCDPSSDGEDACAVQFIDAFGARAFRRPLDDVERDAFVSLFESTRDLDGFDLAIELVVQAMLQSPQFLYRIELGQDVPGDVVPLTPHEIASRLSYLLWESTPDEALLAAADSGALSDPAEIATQAQRMLADDKARATVSHFVAQWTDTTDLPSAVKDVGAFPAWDETLATSMQEETQRLVEDVVFDGEGTLAALLTASHTFVNGPLAELYGVAGPSDAETWQRVDLDPSQRAGLLTQPSVLAAHAHATQTSIVLRGVFVRENVLCQTLQDPPGDLDITLPPLDPDLSTRERFARHIQDPACSSCHLLTDPIGLGFEHYDAVGAWRDTEGDGVPIDASGEVVGAGPYAGPFTGAVELADRLSVAGDVERCFALSWWRYGYGRDPGEDDQCQLGQLSEGFVGHGDVQSLLLELTATETFRTRPRVQP